MTDADPAVEPDTPVQDPDDAHGSPYGFLLYLLMFLGLQAVAGVIAVLAGFPLPLNENPLSIQLVALIGGGLNIIGIWYLARKAFHRPYLLAGFRPATGLLSLSLWIGLALLTMIIAVTLQNSFFFYVLDIEPVKDDNLLLAVGDDGGSFLIFGLMYINGVILVPLVEEVIFRGFMLQRLLARHSAMLSVGLSSLLFAAVHFNPHSFFPLFALALVAGASVVATRSIIPAIGIHFINNFIAVSNAVQMATSTN